MARAVRIKEEIGWLKVPFGLLAMIDASLLGWLTQSYTTADQVIIFTTSSAMLIDSAHMKSCLGGNW